MNAAEFLVQHFQLNKEEGLIIIPEIIFLIDWDKARAREGIDSDLIDAHQLVVQLGQNKANIIATTEPALRPIVERAINLGFIIESSCAGHATGSLKLADIGKHPWISIIFPDPERGVMFITALEKKFDRQFEIEIKGNKSPIFSGTINDGLSRGTCLIEKLPIQFQWTAAKTADLVTIWKMFSEILDEFDDAGSESIPPVEFAKHIDYQKLDHKKTTSIIELLKSIESTRSLINSIEKKIKFNTRFWTTMEAAMILTFVIVTLVPWLGLFHILLVPLLMFLATVVFFHSIPFLVNNFGKLNIWGKAGSLASVVLSFALFIFACRESCYVLLKILVSLSTNSSAYLC